MGDRDRKHLSDRDRKHLSDRDRKHLSVFMVKILRHDARNRHIHMTSDGYVRIKDILDLPEARHFDFADVIDIIDKDGKGRFKRRGSGNETEVQATQGHTMGVEIDLKEITHASEVRTNVLHGTTNRSWELIKSSGGLSRRNRDHIHFAPGRSAQSGMPENCHLAIELDIGRALKDGIRFYKSDNGVILSPGNADGMISKTYFRRVFDLHTGDDIPISTYA